MVHNRMLDRFPSVMLSSKGNELKIYQGNIVYLNNGDNFELKFFNPSYEKIGVEINFNGIKKGDGYLVLNPGQDLTLDRFLDEQRKMIFETYVIDGNNEAAVKAIQENGVISFNFYKESNRGSYNNCNENVNINYNFPPKPYKYNKIYHNNYNNNYYGSGTLGNLGSSGISGVSGTVRGAAGVSGNISFSQDYFIPSMTTTSVNINPLETGRIEKGDISGQKLKAINAQFASSPFYSVTYKLMPISAMNKGINEVRFYCAHCGYRIRKNTWEFCPKCGSHLD